MLVSVIAMTAITVVVVTGLTLVIKDYVSPTTKLVLRNLPL